MTTIKPHFKLPYCDDLPLVPLACQELIHATDLLEKCSIEHAQPCISTSTYSSPKKEKPTPPLAFLGNLLTLGMAGCGGSQQGDISPKITGLEPLAEETAISLPISGRVRGLSFAETGAGTLIGAWSVADSADLMAQGTFGVSIDGESHSLFPGKVNSDMAIPRETHVAALGNSTSVTLFRRVTDPSEPGQLVFQLYSQEGNKTGVEEEVVRTHGVGAKVIPLQEGFGVLYQSGDDVSLKLKIYNFLGQLRGEQTITLDATPNAMAVTQGTGGAWALAALQGQNVEVRRFEDTQANLDYQRVGSAAIVLDSKLSVAMAPNGSIMVAWNAIREGNIPFLQGMFLAPNGQRLNQDFDLQELTRVIDENGQVFINSHALTTDESGNFILAFEQGGNIQILSFRSALDAEAPQGFANLVPHPSPVASEPSFESFLMGLTSPKTTRDEISVLVHDRMLYLGNVLYLSGENNESTQTIAGITYRPFEITYQE